MLKYLRKQCHVYSLLSIGSAKINIEKVRKVEKVKGYQLTNPNRKRMHVRMV